LRDGDSQIPHLPGDALHLRQSQQLYIEMPADLDQFGREDSHGAVIGGKGLVQLDIIPPMEEDLSTR